MKEWIYSIIVIILLTTIITIIVPEGKLGKMIKSIFSLITMLVIVSPVVSLSSYNEIDFTVNSQIDSGIQESFLTFINDNKVEIIENEIVDCFNEIDVCGAIIDLDYEYTEEYVFSIKSAKIYLNNAVINSKKEHILVIEDMVKIVMDKTNLSEKNIFIYE